MLDGFTDWHSHVLPGVDDGIRTLEESLEVLEAYQNLGVRKLWLTPHIMEDYPNETAFLRERFKLLQDAWKGTMEIKLASENMLDSLFEMRLEANDFLPIGDEGRHLLVETSYFNPPYGMDKMLDGIFSAGYEPVLAHPERYSYMDKEGYRSLKERGILFQMNFMSLAGAYGETAKKKAEWLLEQDMVNLTGSDVHRLRLVKEMIARPVGKKSVDALFAVASQPVIT